MTSLLYALVAVSLLAAPVPELGQDGRVEEVPEAWIIESPGRREITLVPESHYPTRYENEPRRRGALENQARLVEKIAIEGFGEIFVVGEDCLDSSALAESNAVRQAREKWIATVNPSASSLEMLRILSSRSLLLALSPLTHSEMVRHLGSVDEAIIFGSRLSRVSMVKSLRPNDVSHLEAGAHRRQWCAAPRHSRERRIADFYSFATDWAGAYRRLSESDLSASIFYDETERDAVDLLIDAIRCAGLHVPCKALDRQVVDERSAGFSRSGFPDAHAIRTEMGFRNEEMTQKLLEMSQKGSVLAVVGALHVASFEVDGRVEKGLLQRLEEAGYRASPLYLCGSAYCKKPVGKRSSARSLGAQPATGLSSGAGQ